MLFRSLHATEEIQRLKQKIYKTEQKEAISLKEEAILKEDFLHLSEKMKSFKEELTTATEAKRNILITRNNETELMKSEKNRALLLKSAEIEALKRKRELLNNWQTLHSNFLVTLKKILKKKYLSTEAEDMEHLLATYYLHHKQIQNTSLFGRKQKDGAINGTKNMIKRSNEILENLCKSPPVTGLSERDPRVETFGLIWDIISDNIKMRLDINNHVEGLLLYNKRKLEDIVEQIGRASCRERVSSPL